MIVRIRKSCGWEQARPRLPGQTRTGPQDFRIVTYDLTGLTWGQLTMLSIMVTAEISSITKPDAKKPPAVDLFHSVILEGYSFIITV